MSEDESKISKLDRNLYSRTNYHAPEDRRSPLGAEDEVSVGDKFQGEELDELLRYERKPIDRNPLIRRIFYISLVFFVIAAGTAAYIYFGGGNFVSSKNVDISVNGPVSVSAGDILNLGITVTNTNNADLQTADLTITYPDGTRDPVDNTTTLDSQKLSLGVISSGQAVSTSTSAVMYGQKGDIKDVTLNLEYEIKGSNATFSKQKVYEISIGTIPLTMTVSQPSATVVSGNTFTTSINVVSNSTNVVKGVLVQAQYPYGFAVVSSNPQALNQAQNLWSLGDMAPGSSKTVNITGVLNGQDAEQRTFRFSAGVGSSDAPTQFDTALTSASETLSINRPNVGLVLSLGGDNSNPYIAPLGQTISGSLAYQNNMTGKLVNGKIVLKFSGAALDKFSVVAQNGGFYDSAQNQIVWDTNSNSNFSALSPGDSGTLSFQFASLAPKSGSVATSNQEIDLTGTISGVDQSGNAITSNDTRTVKIASEVDASADAVYSTGPFRNKGPIPPKAEATTTYTILLGAKNTQNDISNTVFTATLGPNVTWVGANQSGSDSVSYDDTTRTVTWNLGTLSSGTGFSSPARQAAIQVSISPSIGQVGSVPILLNNISLTGKDSFTNTAVSVSATPVTTRISTDPQYVQGDETVVK